MIDAPKEFNQEFCDLRHEIIAKNLNGMNQTIDKVDSRVFKILVVALSQACALIASLAIVAVKFL